MNDPRSIIELGPCMANMAICMGHGFVLNNPGKFFHFRSLGLKFRLNMRIHLSILHSEETNTKTAVHPHTCHHQKYRFEMRKSFTGLRSYIASCHQNSTAFGIVLWTLRFGTSSIALFFDVFCV